MFTTVDSDEEAVEMVPRRDTRRAAPPAAPAARAAPVAVRAAPARVYISHSRKESSRWKFGYFFAELMGTAFLTFAIVATRGKTNGVPPVGGGVLQTAPVGGLVGVALVHAFSLSALAASFGHVSGGHFNPAVTLGFMVTREIHPLVGILYQVFQYLGAVLGGLLAWGLVGNVDGAANVLQDGYAGDEARLFFCEMVATAFLVLVIFNAGVSGGADAAAYLSIGFALGVGVLTIGPVTNASMNPARTLGASVAANSDDYPNDSFDPWSNIYIAILGQYIGGAIAAMLYAYVWKTDEDASSGPELRWWRRTSSVAPPTM